ncbi:MAG: hypothetical protein ACK5JF_00790 [Oscillospiraceae bacterium]
MANYNNKMSKWKLCNIMHANFSPGDAHVVYLHDPQKQKDGKKRPNVEWAAKELEKAKRKLRDKLKADGKKFKFISATAIGERGALHHHIVMNVSDLKLLQSVWPHGAVSVKALYSSGNFAGLAKYFCGQGKGEDGGAIEIFGKGWSCSQGLKRPAPAYKKIDKNFWREPPEVPRGYLIDPLSIDAGVNPITDAPYLFYRAIKIPIPKPFKSKDPQKLEEHIKNLQKEIREVRARNREEIKEVFAEKYAEMELRLKAPESEEPDDTG